MQPREACVFGALRRVPDLTDASAQNAARSQSTQRRRCTCKSRCSIALSRRERVGVRGCVTPGQRSIIAKLQKLTLITNFRPVPHGREKRPRTVAAEVSTASLHLPPWPPEL